MFDAAHEVALVQVGRVDIAVEREDAARTLIDGGVADVGTAHEVALDIPEAAHLNPDAPLELEDAVARHEELRGGHVGAVGGSRNAGGELVAGGDERLGGERLLAGVGVGVDEEALAGFGVLEACPEEVGLVGGQDVALRHGHLDAEVLEDGLLDARLVVAQGALDGAVALGLLEHCEQLLAVGRDVVGQVAVVGALECEDNLWP